MNEYKQMIAKWIRIAGSKKHCYRANKGGSLSCCRKTLYNLINDKTKVNNATLQQLAGDFNLDYQDETEDFVYLKETGRQCIQAWCDNDELSLANIKNHFNVRLYRRFILLNDYALMIQAFFEFTEKADLTYCHYYNLFSKDRSIYANELLPLVDFMTFYDAVLRHDFAKAQLVLLNNTLSQREQMLYLILNSNQPVRAFYRKKLDAELSPVSGLIGSFYRGVCCRLFANNNKQKNGTNDCTFEKINRYHKRKMRELAETANNDESLRRVLAYAQKSRQYKIVYDYILACREADEADGNY